MSNRGWNDDYEKIVKSIGEESIAYAWMNRQTGNYRKKLDDFYDILSITLASIATLIASIVAVYPSDNKQIITIINIIVPVVVALSAIVAGIRKHYSWNKLYPLNELMYKKFNTLANDCSMILMMTRDHRYLTGKQFVLKKGKKYNKLTKLDENNILEKYRREFVERFSKLGVYIPDQIKEILISSDTINTDVAKTRNNVTNESVTNTTREITASGECKTEKSFLSMLLSSKAVHQVEELAKGKSVITKDVNKEYNDEDMGSLDEKNDNIITIESDYSNNSE